MSNLINKQLIVYKKHPISHHWCCLLGRRPCAYVLRLTRGTPRYTINLGGNICTSPLTTHVVSKGCVTEICRSGLQSSKGDQGEDPLASKERVTRSFELRAGCFILHLARFCLAVNLRTLGPSARTRTFQGL